MTQIKHFRAKVPFKADSCHSEYPMKTGSPHEGVMLGIGLNYIRFAVEKLAPVLSAMKGAVGGSIEQVKEIFITVFLFAHGYAGIIADNSLEYDEELIRSQLEQAYRGAVLAVQEKGINTVPALSF